MQLTALYSPFIDKNLFCVTPVFIQLIDFSAFFFFIFFFQVSPQFDSSVPIPPVRRGRRKCQSATSVLDSVSQLSRKGSVCRFPSLTFQTRSSDQSHKPKRTHAKKATECAVASDVGNQPSGSRQNTRTVSSVTPKRQTASIRKRNVQRFSDGAASTSRCLDRPETPSAQVTHSCGGPAVDGASTPASNEFSGVSPPPDVDTPKVIQEGSSGASSAALHLLLPQSGTPPCNQPPDILVADTPERDYGVKVTWRRRRGLMLLYKERGHLSDSDVLTCS